MTDPERDFSDEPTLTDERPCYLGDGVYVSWDGFHIWLKTGSHEDEHATNKIALEPEVFAALVRYQRMLVEALARKAGS